MKCRLCAIRRLLLLLLTFLSFSAMAQPMLPAITGAADSGLVLLTWVCQYDGVKTIVVKRSGDSAFNYKIIGYVKKTNKGMQVFADGHPQAGNNYYMLTIVFNSGLNWSSNHCRVFVDSAQVAARIVVPGNDSLQRLIILDDTPEPSAFKNEKAGMEGKGIHDRKVTLSFNTDTAGGKPEPATVRRKITIVFPEQDMEDIAVVKSRYVSVSPLNGHVMITLPDDYARHHYAVKFYNSINKMILEVPVLKSAPVILDKRNFQRKGVYKFVLRKDGVELESGYVTIIL